MAVDTWWNSDYSYRRKIHSHVKVADTYTSGVYYFNVPLDVVSLIGAGKVRADLNDLRIVYQPSGASMQEIMRFAASGRNRVHFPCMSTIASGVEIGNQTDYAYYVYYGHSAATANYPAWSNINFPQAPYSPTLRSSPTTSGIYDHFLVRLNDGSGLLRFEDATGQFTGLNQPSGIGNIQVHQPGRLDRSVFWPSGHKANRVKVNAYGTFDKDELEPSGYWCVDAWIKPYNLGDANDTYHHWFTKQRTSSTIQIFGRWAGDNLATKKIRTYEYAANWDNINVETAGIWTDQWLFVRVAYDRVNNDRDYIWIRGSGVDQSDDQADAAAPSAKTGSNAYKYINIGAYFGNEAPSLYGYVGNIEQVRYSLFPADAHPTFAPDFADPEYELYLDTEESGGGAASASAFFVLG